MTETIPLALLAFVASLSLTWLVRHYALRRSLLDIPNERSSHVIATPRGGGLAIAMTVLMAVGYLWSRSLIPTPLAMALLFGGGGVALLGWVDDHRPLGVLARLVVQLAAAACALVAFAGFDAVETGFGRLQLGWMLGSALAVLGIIWLTNLYNFLDGTDGYAGTEAICAAVAGAALLLYAGDPGLAMLCALIAAASAGFLVWNWSPARVFLGDVGSYFLGYTFGVLALWGEKSGAVPAYVWVILLGVFVWDATLTLIRRILAGERWLAAHRTHAYQRLHQLGVSHSRIALLLLAVNVLLLWPLAYVAAVWNNRAMWAVLASAGLLIAAWWFIQARFKHRRSGMPE